MSIRRYLPLVLLFTSCETPDYPGEALGTYKYTGVVVTNTCGDAAFSPPNPIEFRAEVRKHNSLYLWRWPDGPSTYGSHQQEEIKWVSQRVVSGYGGEKTPSGQPCIFQQREEIRLNIEDPEQLTKDDEVEGTNLIRIEAAAGSDCSPSLAAYGGPFLSLPCEVTYQLSGVREAEDLE